MKSVRLKVWIAALSLGLTACFGFADVEPAKGVCEKYFKAVEQSDVASIDSLHSPKFFQTTPPEKWAKVQAKIHDKLGTYQSHEFINSNTLRTASSSEPGDYVTLRYEVTYSKGKAKETFQLYTPSPEEPYRIDGHDVRWDIEVE